MAKNRNYSFKDIDMLIGSKTVTESYKANMSELSAIRTNWNVTHANTLSDKIDDAIENKLGIDIKKDLRNASAILNALMIPAKRDIAFFKVQIVEDFKNDKTRQNEILKTLGFNQHLTNIQNGDQEALIQFLYTFKQNMDVPLQTEITAKGMNPQLIIKISDYANNVKQADVAQENYKETTKEITDEIKTIFNEIYDEVITICKYASKYYQYEPHKKEQFTFQKILSNMNLK